MAEKTGLLVRTRGNYVPSLLGAVVAAWGLYDATYGLAMLRAIRRRAEAAADVAPIDPSPR
jgi:hypothetical protein